MRRISEWILLGLATYLAFVFGAAALKGRLSSLYRKHFPETRHERLFLASVGFFVAFVIVRILTHAIRAGIGPFHDISASGLHIHHLVWGILALLLVGYCWLVQIGTGMPGTNLWIGRFTALAYGAAAALTLDEFALWLNLRDVYWSREGRESIRAVFFFGGLLSIGVWGGPFLHAVTREALRLLFRRKT
jgi:hypothetical protein